MDADTNTTTSNLSLPSKRKLTSQFPKPNTATHTQTKKNWPKNHLAKDGVLFVEVGRVVQGEEKLAMVGAWLVLVRHRHLATMVELDAGVDLVPKSFAVDALSPFARAGRIPALDHELPDDAMEHRVVVVLRDVIRAGKLQAGCGWQENKSVGHIDAMMRG